MLSFMPPKMEMFGGSHDFLGYPPSICMRLGAWLKSKEQHIAATTGILNSTKPCKGSFGSGTLLGRL